MIEREAARIGRRIHVIGNSCSGKSTLAARLARALGVPHVELDALNWLPGWVGLNETNPEELELRIGRATAGEAWVVAGSYHRFSKRTFWPRLDTVVWLDLPRILLALRAIVRSWKRARSRELLWGTNRERFWPHLRLWRRDSLLWWILTQHGRKRQDLLACMADPQWGHIQFIRLTSPAAIERFAAKVEGGFSSGTMKTP